MRSTYYIYLITLLFTFPQLVHASTVCGIVKDANSQSIPMALISVGNSSQGMVADYKGKFCISLPAGQHTITASMTGYLPKTTTITLGKDTLNISITLEEKIEELDEVQIIVKSKAELTKEKGFAVDVIEIKEYEQTHADVNQVLSESPGVVIRQHGGLGSNFDFSLNGLSGKQVRFFIDGIPMESFGNSFTLNNFPVNLVKNIEVYKGVVPIALGADALAGAVNIVSDHSLKNYLNTTYSYGSFNTHRIGFLAQRVNKKNAFLKITGFYNYSDNDYKMDDLRVTDEFGNINGTISTKRFHDQYSSTMIQVTGGVKYKPWAKNLSLGATYSGNDNNVQHDLSLLRPYGKVSRHNQLFNGFVQFEKDSILLPKLNMDLYSSFGAQETSIIDTSSNKYNWFGTYIVNTENPGIGETSSSKSLFKFNDFLSVNKLNLSYKLSTNQNLKFNYTQNYVRRVGEDAISTGVVPFNDPHSINKNVFGLSHELHYAKDKATSTIFAKNYRVNFKITQADFEGNKSREDSTFGSFGYGTAQSFEILKNWRLNASYEYAYRVPDAYEMFGDGFNIKANTALVPETSHNINIGILTKKEFSKLSLIFEENYFKRNAKNFIRVEAVGPFARYNNQQSVTVSGSETSLKVKYKKFLHIGANLTYQNVYDTDKPFGDKPSDNRLANIPFLFGHTHTGISKTGIRNETDKLSLFVIYNFREEFYLISPAEGDPKTKNPIPRQSSVDTSLKYNGKDNKYSITLSLTNITNQKLYDNFRIQKPGRAFTIMLKYFLI